MGAALSIAGMGLGAATSMADAQRVNRSARQAAQTNLRAYQSNQANISSRRSLALQEAAMKLRRANSTNRLLTAESGLGGRASEDRAASIASAAALEVRAINENQQAQSTEAFFELESALNALESRMQNTLLSTISGGASGFQSGLQFGSGIDALRKK